MYISSFYLTKTLCCAEPRTLHYQHDTHQTRVPARNYLDEMLQAGFNLKFLANQSQISLSTLYRLANGEIRKPTYKTFRRLLKTYCQLIVLK